MPDLLHHHGILIMGAGLIGLGSSLEVAEKGLDCGVISRVSLFRFHSVAAQGGINAHREIRLSFRNTRHFLFNRLR